MEWQIIFLDYYFLVLDYRVTFVQITINTLYKQSTFNSVVENFYMWPHTSFTFLLSVHDINISLRPQYQYMISIAVHAIDNSTCTWQRYQYMASISVYDINISSSKWHRYWYMVSISVHQINISTCHQYQYKPSPSVPLSKLKKFKPQKENTNGKRLYELIECL